MVRRRAKSAISVEDQIREVSCRIDHIRRRVQEQKNHLAELAARGDNTSQAILILEALEADLASAEGGRRWLEGSLTTT